MQCQQSDREEEIYRLFVVPYPLTEQECENPPDEHTDGHIRTHVAWSVNYVCVVTGVVEQAAGSFVWP